MKPTLAALALILAGLAIASPVPEPEAKRKKPTTTNASVVDTIDANIMCPASVCHPVTSDNMPDYTTQTFGNLPTAFVPSVVGTETILVVPTGTKAAKAKAAHTKSASSRSTGTRTGKAKATAKPSATKRAE